MDDDEWFTLAELHERLGALVWVEEHVSELARGWSSVESAHGPRIVFATASEHHRWHGEILRQCLATSPQLNELDVVRAPTSGWQEAVLHLAGLSDPQATTARLRALVKIIDPWIDRETAALMELSRPVSDAAAMRWLRFASLDHHHDADAAHELLAAFETETIQLEDLRVLGAIDLTQ